MELETTRLRIIPLDLEQSKLLADGVAKIERQLGLTPIEEPLDEKTLWVMQYVANKAIEYPSDTLWFTALWLIVLKSENRMIASLSFKGEPNDKKEVEIGYGTNEGYRNKGYMSEAVQAVSEWSVRQENIDAIIAETYKDNEASHKVLQKCRMEKYLETDTSFWWRYPPL
ncbi:GNAT family N-acetyltransferase [Dysgonomonas sp. ZJ279]|uniref:GNAT family N-acetyltransferase n=1 Tax=Dysgonomonas sp. ZJ279 TaxID=2709796 RepID=UPI0013EC0FAD|nr:GNAT family N-acetyltransferase [Dysgonomonas sp. ZJ279]